MALTARGLTISMSRLGSCYDNAVVESFFAPLKRELMDRQTWPTAAGVDQALAQYILLPVVLFQGQVSLTHYPMRCFGTECPWPRKSPGCLTLRQSGRTDCQVEL